ncbi:hypothetical protein WME99_22185 [Sorangium sp. So ce136]|uniref:hypothetical protein n=1 Tax=Sorangium sp. So ce136 TaxID=3133284 RepID=UPI003F11658E
MSTDARAEEGAPPRWQVDVKAAYVVLGAHAARATGGIMPSVTGMRRWPVRDAVDVGIGADVGLFGLGGGARWLGVLGGPTASAQVMLFPTHAKAHSDPLPNNVQDAKSCRHCLASASQATSMSSSACSSSLGFGLDRRGATSVGWPTVRAGRESVDLRGENR